MKLYQISDELLTLYSIPIDGNEEGENWQAFEELLKGLEGQFERKTDNILSLIKNWNIEAEMLEAQARCLIEEAQRLKRKASARLNASEKMKEYILEELKKVNKQKVKTTMFTCWIQKAKDVVDVFDENILPDGTYKKLPDKTKIEKIIKSGEEVPGARLQEGKEFIQMR